jgi:RNA polymerase-interacting CarD/CdnL/TRCF family regulator
MVRSLHRHKDEQAAAGRKFHLCDENFLRDSEKLLSSEFALVLNMDHAQAVAYIKEALEK